MSILVKACSHLGNTGQTADVVHRLHSLLEDKNVGKKSFSSVFKTLELGIDNYDFA